MRALAVRSDEAYVPAGAHESTSVSEPAAEKSSCQCSCVALKLIRRFGGRKASEVR